MVSNVPQSDYFYSTTFQSNEFYIAPLTNAYQTGQNRNRHPAKFINALPTGLQKPFRVGTTVA